MGEFLASRLQIEEACILNAQARAKIQGSSTGQVRNIHDIALGAA